jgi:putative membrane protein
MVTNSQTAVHAESLRPPSDELALDRSRLACERTMMAWIRTSASMISFEFGIYKFVDYFKGERPVTQGIVSPGYFATFLIDTGPICSDARCCAELGRSFAVYAGRVPISLAGGGCCSHVHHRYPRPRCHDYAVVNSPMHFPLEGGATQYETNLLRKE